MRCYRGCETIRIDLFIGSSHIRYLHECKCIIITQLTIRQLGTTGDGFHANHAGETLFAGAEDQVMAFGATEGDMLWQAKVDGKVYGLAVAGKKLLVSTDTGSILCFSDKNGG